MAYKKYRTMVMDMCGSLDIAKEASRGGNTKRLSHHTETSGYEALLHETDDNDSEDDDRQLVELLVNRLSQKKISGNRPASKTLRATMLSADIYRQLSVDDKKVWKQLSDVGKALFVKSMPTTVESAAQLRSAMKHETEEDDSTEDNDNDHDPSDETVVDLPIWLIIINLNYISGCFELWPHG